MGVYGERSSTRLAIRDSTAITANSRSTKDVHVEAARASDMMQTELKRKRSASSGPRKSTTTAKKPRTAKTSLAKTPASASSKSLETTTQQDSSEELVIPESPEAALGRKDSSEKTFGELSPQDSAVSSRTLAAENEDLGADGGSGSITDENELTEKEDDELMDEKAAFDEEARCFEEVQRRSAQISPATTVRESLQPQSGIDDSLLIEAAAETATVNASQAQDESSIESQATPSNPAPALMDPGMLRTAENDMQPGSPTLVVPRPDVAASGPSRRKQLLVKLPVLRQRSTEANPEIQRTTHAPASTSGPVPKQATHTERVNGSRRPVRARKAPQHFGKMVQTPTGEELDGVVESTTLAERDEPYLASKARTARKTKQPTTGPLSTGLKPTKVTKPQSPPAAERKAKSIEDLIMDGILNPSSEGTATQAAKPRHGSVSKVVAGKSTTSTKASRSTKTNTPSRKPRPAAKSTTIPATPVRVPAGRKGGAAAAYPSPPGTQTSEQEPSVAELEIDPELLGISRALTYRRPIEEKEKPQGQPRVWADSRQALCETVPYFKKPQGGCHSNDRHVYAFLFDGVGHCREYMDSDVIIARAGGGMEADSTGSMVQGKDQSMTEAQVQAVINDVALQNPLIVICGNKNIGALCQMPHKYCVLGWYKPVGVWAEKTVGKGKKSWTTIKYRFERLTGSGEPAWHSPKAVDLPDVSGVGDLFKKSCTACGQRHPQIYLESWLCLNPTCTSFWKLENGFDAPSGKLEYNPAYLLKRTMWEVEAEPFDVKPPLPNIGKAIGDNLTYINTRGICCPECGRCNPRYKFKGWHCDNPSCSWVLPAQHQPIMPASLHSPWDSLGDGPALGRNKHEASVNVEIRYTHGYKVYKYTFTGVQGCFIHAVANIKINQELPDGPDAMLAEVQTVEMGLERRRFGGEKMPGAKAEKAPETPQRQSTGQTQVLTPPAEETRQLDQAVQFVDEEEGSQAPTKKPEIEDGDFMTAFSMNYGMPYKFVASGASQPFESAPRSVRACRSRLNWAAREFLSDPSGETDFNEELIFAYMEGQKIEYHDDGEEGLGPRIATLSLGGKAKMHLRMKAKHFVGCSKTGVLTADEPLVGSMEYEKRHRHWQELQQLKDTDRPAYQRRTKEIPKELGIYEKRNKKADDLVTVTLSHGDIILMDGYDIQKFLEHKVVPEGYLRFALTCRTVLEHHLKEHERPSYEVLPDDYGYDGSKLR